MVASPSHATSRPAFRLQTGVFAAAAKTTTSATCGSETLLFEVSAGESNTSPRSRGSPLLTLPHPSYGCGFQICLKLGQMTVRPDREAVLGQGLGRQEG